MTHPRIAAIILAGGQARRMGGGDKPLLKIGAETMLARVIAALETPDIAISANGDPERFAAFRRPVLGDGALAGEGPLAGILAGLDWAADLGAEALLSVPGDSPFVPRGLAAALWPPPACAASGGRLHPLTALWPVGCRAQLRGWLAEPGSRHVRRFTTALGMRVVDFAIRARDPFLNVNTADDLATARALASSERTEGPQ